MSLSLLATVLLAGTTSFFPNSAGAQTPDAATVSVSPPRDELDAAPGQTITRTIRLTNSFSQPRTFNAKVQNFEASGEEGQASLTSDSGRFSLMEWSTVTPAQATIQPQKNQDFEVTIRVPANAGPGGRYGAVVFSPVVAPDQNANLSIVSEVSSLLLVRIPGEAVEKLSVAGFSAQDRSTPPEEASFFTGGPVDFALRLNNEGNVHLRPQINVSIKNMFGSEIATLAPESATTLPGSIRRYTVPWDHKQLFGRYSVEATVTYGAKSEVLTTSTTFWAAPVRQILIVLLVLLAVFLLLWLPRRRLRKALKALTAGD